MPDSAIVLAAREDAARRARRDRLREERGRDYNPHLAWCYAVYRVGAPKQATPHLIGFIHGKLTCRRMDRFRKRAKVPVDWTVKFVDLILAGRSVS